MQRTRICDRELPFYTHGEEIFNMVSHIVGGAFGIFALVSCLLVAASKQNVWGLVSSAIYGTTLILLYSSSSVYHGLAANTAKKVMQVVDHCTIYFLIAGTYTPIVLYPLREYAPAWAWTIFGLVWACAVVGSVFTAIDLKKYAKLSMLCYLGMGWCIVLAAKPALAAIPLPGLLWLLAGGISYSIGAVLYGLGRTRRYMHSVFHVFVLLGSVLQYIAILFYAL